MTTTAATQTGETGSGQAASAQQGAQTQPGTTGTQSGQGTTGQGQQGDGSGTAQQTGQATGTQGTGTTGQATGQATGTAGAAATAPERYELTLPEASPLDQSDLDTVAALAKAKAWTTEEAQAAVTEMHTALVDQTARFRAELDADPEVGGAQLEQAQAYAQRALDRFLPEREVLGQRLRSAMNKSGYGNFLPLVTLLARIGKAMSEDQPGPGSTGRVTPPTKSQADRLFGDAQGVKPPA